MSSLVDPPRASEWPSLLVLARHGLSLMNHLGDYSTFLPEDTDTSQLANISNHTVPLMDQGREQARILGLALHKRYGPFDVICYSDMVRSIDSAREVLTALDQRTVPEELRHTLFNERNPGYFFGMTQKEAEWIYSRQFVMEQLRIYERDGWFYARPFGGESIAEMVNTRVPSALRLTCERYGGKRVLMVVHGTWIRAARVVLGGLPVDTARQPFCGLGNCGYVTYRCTRNGLPKLLHTKRGPDAPP